MLVDLIFAISEILILLSYFFNDILILRTITIFGMTSYVIGAFTAGYNEAGMKALILFSVLSVLVNVVKIFFLINERKPIVIPEDIKDLYQISFSPMAPREFIYLTHLATKTFFNKNDIIAKQDQPINDLIMINHGEASILINDKVIAEVSPGDFIGEMSYLTGKLATATVRANETMECLVWKKEVLKGLHKKHPDLYNIFVEVIGINLVHKITKPIMIV